MKTIREYLKAASLRTQLVVAVSIGLLAFLSLVGASTFGYLKQNAVRSLQSQLFDLVRIQADQLDIKLLLAQGALEKEASEIDASMLTDAHRAQRFLDTRWALKGIFDSGLFLVDNEGNIVAESPYKPGLRGRNIAYREFFSIPTETKRSYISKPYESVHAKGRPSVIIVVPIFNKQGEFVGRLHGLFELLGANFLSALPLQKIGQNGYFYVTTNDRLIVAHPDKNRLMKPAAAPGQNVFYDRALDGFEGSGSTTNSSGVKMLIAIKRLSSTGWILAGQLPETEALAPFWRAAWLLVIASIVLGAFLILACAILISNMLKPVAYMVEHMKKVPTLRANDRRMRVSAGPDLSEIVTGFNTMVEELVSSESQRNEVTDQLRQLNVELEDRVRRRTFELESANAELGRARDTAESATRAKSEFLANMSHEIRTPMNAVLGMTDLVLRSELTEKQRDYLVKAKGAAVSLLGIINDILDFSKIEAGRLELEEGEFLLSEVLDKLTAIIAIKAQEKDLDFLLNVPQNVPLALIGDPLRLSQILLNLCSNAVKFTNEGEIIVSVERLEQAGDEVSLKFSVRDSGIGMSEEQKQKLFLPFSQADTSTTRKYGGTGLGLAISRQLVALMGGEIGLESKIGEGSVFYFTARFRLGQSEVISQIEAAFSLPKVRILVIDDSQNAREILSSYLSAFGYEATCCASGREGLDELERSQPTPYELVLMDWKMPAMDGFEAARAILRQPERYGRPKIVMVTAYGNEGIQQRVEEERLDGYISKPVSMSSLLDTLSNVFVLRVTPTVAMAKAADAKVSESFVQIKGMRVLLVEDNEINQQIAKDLLQAVAGVDVKVACNGEEALQKIEQNPFDAVLMDIQMPVMDGYEATRQIRSRADYANLPIIAMTAHAMVKDRERCLQAGMNDYVTKPFDPPELFLTLAKWYVKKENSKPDSTSAIEEPESSSESFDFEKGLAHCFGRQDIYDKLIESFLRNNSDTVEQLRKALLNLETEQALLIAHSLKSSAATIGADALSTAADALEQAIASSPNFAHEALLQRFEMALQDVLERLEKHFAKE